MGETGEKKIALVTGSTAGLGAEVARRLGALDWHVIVHGRDRDRGGGRVAELEGEGSSADFYAADFGQLSAVREFAEAIRSDYDHLELLINNAPSSGYARSKLAQVMYTVDLAEELEGRDIELEAGQYFDGTEPTRAHRQAYDTAARERLREAVEELIEAA